jgi:DNA-binding NarL/FixJ family response regulator
MVVTERPLIVARSRGAMEACVARLEQAGARTQRTWRVERDTGGTAVVCVGRVSTPADVQEALLAAVGGAGMVALLPTDPALSAAFFEDLRHLGSVEVVEEHDQSSLGQLDEEQRRLLELLAGGASATSAARTLFLSRRTVVRRLAAARATLAVRSNAEAVLALCTAVHGEP